MSMPGGTTWSGQRAEPLTALAPSKHVVTRMVSAPVPVSGPNASGSNAVVRVAYSSPQSSLKEPLLATPPVRSVASKPAPSNKYVVTRQVSGPTIAPYRSQPLVRTSTGSKAGHSPPISSPQISGGYTPSPPTRYRDVAQSSAPLISAAGSASVPASRPVDAAVASTPQMRSASFSPPIISRGSPASPQPSRTSLSSQYATNILQLCPQLSGGSVASSLSKYSTTTRIVGASSPELTLEENLSTTIISAEHVAGGSPASKLTSDSQEQGKYSPRVLYDPLAIPTVDEKTEFDKQDCKADERSPPYESLVAPTDDETNEFNKQGSSGGETNMLDEALPPPTADENIQVNDQDCKGEKMSLQAFVTQTVNQDTEFSKQDTSSGKTSPPYELSMPPDPDQESECGKKACNATEQSLPYDTSSVTPEIDKEIECNKRKTLPAGINDGKQSSLHEAPVAPTLNKDMKRNGQACEGGDKETEIDPVEAWREAGIQQVLSPTNARLSPNQIHHYHGFNFVFVFPLPSDTTDKEDQAFWKKFSTDAERRNGFDISEHIVVSPGLRKLAKLDSCATLCEVRNVTIEMFRSFMLSLGTSLQSGLEIFEFTSEDCDELFMCVKIGDHLGEKLACMSDYPLQLCPSALEKLHIKISDTTDVCPTYVGYDTYLSQEDWLIKHKRHDNNDAESILRPVDNMRLLYDKITDYIDLYELQRLGLLLHIYPGHDKELLSKLRESWGNFRHIFSPDQPIDDIRDYFGEGIAFYYLFLGFLTKAMLILVIPALFCSLAWKVGWSDEAQSIFCCILIIWATSIVKFWRRTESFYANRWGTDREDASTIKDPINPRFHGEKMPSPVDENIMLLQPNSRKRLLGFTVSIIVSFIFTSLAVIGMEINQHWTALQEHKGNTNASYIGAALLSLQIQIWDKVWDFLIVGRLNDLEQHVTQYSADQSRVAKTFVIKFINAFNAFWYIAFIQPSADVEGCGGDCKGYLRTQLIIVMATYITFGVMDMVLPYYSFQFAVWMEQRKIRSHNHTTFRISFLEIQSKMSEYTGSDERADYLSIVLPLAFVMLFGSMCPITVILCWLALTSQIRTHAWKMLLALRRPFPVRTSGIGVWDPILTFITYIAMFNSIALLAYQVEGLARLVPGFQILTEKLEMEENGPAAKILLFFVLQNIAGIYKLVFDFLVSDVTAKTALERSRQEIQRVRIAERGHAEFHEDIQLIGQKDFEKSAFHRIQRLEPEHPLYVEPLV